jgi:hypothetical protein
MGAGMVSPLAIGANLAPAIFDYPVAQLPRVLVWPRNDGKSGHRSLTVFNCLAISADRKFAAQIDEIHLDRDFEEPQRFWQRVCAKLEHIRARFFSRADDWSLRPSMDCFATWGNTAAWLDGLRGDPIHHRAREQAREWKVSDRVEQQEMMDAEAQAHHELEQQFVLGVRHVLSGLIPEIAGLLFERPLLRMCIIERMLMLAKQDTRRDAWRFAMQALRTEAIALLDLAVAVPTRNTGATVLCAILSGSSLPIALQSLGIPKGVHRRAVRRVEADSGCGNVRNGFSEIPLSGGNFFVVLGLVKNLPYERWPRQQTEWGEFITAVVLLHEIAIAHSVLVRVLRWCSVCHFADCSMRIALLIDQVQALMVAARHLCNWNLSIGDAYLVALGMAPIVEASGDALGQAGELLNPQEVERTVIELVHFTGLPVETVAKNAFAVHPGIPEAFQRDPHIEIQPLANLRDVVDHGLSCGTCLQDLTMAIHYAANGVALYAARDIHTDLVGTIALTLEGDDLHQSVIVSQVTGLFNQEASPALFKLAYRFANCFGPAATDVWEAFANQAEYFRLCAGAN